MLTLTVRTPPDFAAASELDYLVSWVVSRAEAAAGPVELVAPDRPAEAVAAAPDRPLLVLDCRTLLTDRSLRRMLRALREGARAVVPVPLARTGLPATGAVYTLRGFERLERRVLDREDSAEAAAREAAEGVPPPLPALLLAPGCAGALPDGATAGELLDTPDAVLPDVARAVAGLCHAFVDYYGQAREDVLPLLPEGCEDVLEVGCGRGATGRLLRERRGCRVTGIELNPVVARDAAGLLDRVVAGDVLQVADDLVREGARFDAVVAFELFEHLTEQEAFLAAARRLLRPGGRVVLSVPNVGHYSVVEDLLAGRWDYLPIGLLCFTHYRFFTRRTVEDWLRRCGFDRFEILPQRTELPEVFRGEGRTPSLAGLELDPESLSTKGFYVVIHV